MADNYIEKRMAEISGHSQKSKRINPTLDTLLKRIPASTSFREGFPVSEDVLRKMTGALDLVPALAEKRSIQVKSVCSEGSHAFLLLSSDCTPDSTIFIDLGIAIQTISLKAVEIGFGIKVLDAGDDPSFLEYVSPLHLLAVLEVGKPE